MRITEPSLEGLTHVGETGIPRHTQRLERDIEPRQTWEKEHLTPAGGTARERPEVLKGRLGKRCNVQFCLSRGWRGGTRFLRCFHLYLMRRMEFLKQEMEMIKSMF